MPVCDVTLQDASVSCNDETAVGGLQAIYLIKQSDITGMTASTADYSYTAIATTADFVRIEGRQGFQTASATGEVGDQGGNNYSVEISTFLNNAKAEKLQALVNAEEAGRVICIAHYAQGQAIVYGYCEKTKLQTQLRATLTVETGGAFNDAQGVTLTISGNMPQPPREYVGDIGYNGGTVTFPSN